MAKVYCANYSCKFANDDGVCTQKKIALSFHSIQTVYDGRQEYSKCKMYEESEHAIEMRRFLEKCEWMK